MLPGARAENHSRILGAARQRQSVASSACGFFAAALDRAAVNQEAGDFASRNSLLFCVAAEKPRLLRRAAAKILLFFFAAKEFVALDSGDYADGAFIAGLGALHAAKATDAYRSGQSNLVGQGQKNLDRRAFPNILGKKEVDTAGADVPRLGAGLTNRGSCSPTDSERQPHGKALGSAAFGTSQSDPPD